MSYCKKRPRTPIKRSPIKKKLALTSILPLETRKKRSPRSIAKDKAVAAFQYYIRIRDSIATTGTTKYCICVTCCERGNSEWKEFRHIQAGHGVGGRGNAVLFNEEVTNGQCDYCNLKPPRGLGGDYGNYALFFVKKYGLEHAEEIQRLRHKTDVVYKLHDFVEIERIYKEKVGILLGG